MSDIIWVEWIMSSFCLYIEILSSQISVRTAVNEPLEIDAIYLLVIKSFRLLFSFWINHLDIFGDTCYPCFSQSNRKQILIPKYLFQLKNVSSRQLLLPQIQQPAFLTHSSNTSCSFEIQSSYWYNKLSDVFKSLQFQHFFD